LAWILHLSCRDNQQRTGNPMAQTTMMVPLQLSGSLPKTTGDKACNALSSSSDGDLEANAFSQTLQDLMDTGNDTYAVILAMQFVALTPEGTASPLQSGSVLPSMTTTIGSNLPLTDAQMQQIETQQALPLGDLKAFEPQQLQVGLPDGKLPVVETGPLLTAAAQAADILQPKGIEGLFGSDGTLPTIGAVGQTHLTSADARPVFALPVQIPVGQPGWDNSVGERLQWMVSKHVQEAQIKLSPPDLGPLEIKISLHNDQTSVSFVANHAATRDALEAAIPRLREMFNEANLNLGHVDVGQRQAGGTAGGDGRGNAGHAAQGDELTTLSQMSSDSTMSYSIRGLLDTYV
jgi:flagellar hook-length control protein FliK